MAAQLVANSYGKERVRLTRISRDGDVHTVKQLVVAVELEGTFEETYFSGSNDGVVATDSMKNTVYVLARNHPLGSIEDFAGDLALHFLSRYEQVSACSVRVEEQPWERLAVGGKAHPTAFQGVQGEVRTCAVHVERDHEPAVTSGIDGLLVLKSTNSVFKGFVRDEFTTLQDADDRIFSTVVQAQWKGQTPSQGYSPARDLVREALLSVFADHYSLSVQQTLYAMGEQVLQQCRWINEIELVLPNKHHLPVNLAPFHLDNPNVIFMPVDEPYGRIRGVIRRAG